MTTFTESARGIVGKVICPEYNEYINIPNSQNVVSMNTPEFSDYYIRGNDSYVYHISSIHTRDFHWKAITYAFPTDYNCLGIYATHGPSRQLWAAIVLDSPVTVFNVQLPSVAKVGGMTIKNFSILSTQTVTTQVIYIRFPKKG